MKAVTTRNLGNFFANEAIPSGLAMRFRKRMRSSGTPREMRTSTAIVADPPDLINITEFLPQDYLDIKRDLCIRNRVE